MRGRTEFITGLILAGGVCFGGAQAVGTVGISGTVKDSKTGIPIVGAAVSLVSDPTLATTTDKTGAFRLEGSPTGLRPSAGNEMARPAMSLSGTALSLDIPNGNTAIAVDLFDLRSAHVGTLMNRRVGAGRYRIDLAASASGLPAGLYLVRARAGGKTASFKFAAPGLRGAAGQGFGPALAARAALAKVSADPIDDTLKISAPGYRLGKKALTLYTGTYPIALFSAPPAGDLKIVSERAFSQVDWADNVEVQVWDGGTQLEGQYKTDPYEGFDSWKITFGSDQLYNAWGFVSKAAPENMSAWKGGTMHLAVKGNTTSLGVTMASADQFPGSSVMVDLSELGYKPDNAWHEILVPMDKFEGVDLEQINVYCGLAYPLLSDTAGYDPTLDYQVDDIYWSVKK